MPTLKQKQLPAQQIRVNRGKGLFAGFREMITEAKDAIVDLLKPKTKTVTKEVTAQVKPAVYEDSDKTWLLNKIGNTYQSTSYLDELKKMIEIWRTDFGDEKLKFVVVQIADYYEIWEVRPPTRIGWKLVQKAQEQIQYEMKNVATVISKDVCETNHIHPPTKTKLSQRIVEVLL